MFRRVRQTLDARGITIHSRWVGEYATSLEMAGASVTLLKLDEALTRLLDHPCHTPELSVGGEMPPLADTPRTARKAQVAADAAVVNRTSLRTGGTVTPETFVRMMRAVAAAIRAEKGWLSQLDGVIGDGDHGVTMDIGWTAVLKDLDAVGADATISEVCERIAHAAPEGVLPPQGVRSRRRSTIPPSVLRSSNRSSADRRRRSRPARASRRGPMRLRRHHRDPASRSPFPAYHRRSSR